MNETFMLSAFYRKNVSLMEKIDSYDRILLETLQENGRASNVELSGRAHLSAPQCYRRVRRLEAEGIIRGYSARLNPPSVGLEIVAYVSLNIDRAQCKQVRDLESTLRTFPEILECYAISGDFDYLLKIVASDLRAFSEFLNDCLTKVPGVSGIKSMLCLDEVKQAAPLPIAEAK